LSLTQKERLGLQKSARVLRETIQQVEKRIGAGPARVADPTRPKDNVISGQPARTIPRSAWQVVR
jgi:hypothetical protein